MRNKLGERIKYWLQMLLLPLYGLSFLVPRNNKIWLFGSTFGRRFAENPRYLYLYVSQHSDGSRYYRNHQNQMNQAVSGSEQPESQAIIHGIRPVWISHDKAIVAFLSEQGYEAYYYHSLKGIALALRAGVYIYDNYSKDINFWQSGGAFKLNLWHGTGNKQINHNNIHDAVRHPKNGWEKWKTWLRRLSDEKPSDYILTTSEEMKPHFASAFQVPSDHVLVAGYPRNDLLFDGEESGIDPVYTPEENELLQRIQAYKQNGLRIVTYMPTFRASESMFFQVMDLEKFNAFLSEEGILLLAKLHVKSKLKAQFEAFDYSNILSVNPNIDTYTFLREAELLITDYSSVYTDYMLLNRPVIAFTYDEQEYERDSREYTISQDEYMPELKAANMEELMENLRILKEHDPRQEARLRSRQRMFQTVTGDASRTIADWLQRMLR